MPGIVFLNAVQLHIHITQSTQHSLTFHRAVPVSIRYQGALFAARCISRPTQITPVSLDLTSTVTAQQRTQAWMSYSTVQQEQHQQAAAAADGMQVKVRRRNTDNTDDEDRVRGLAYAELLLHMHGLGFKSHLCHCRTMRQTGKTEMMPPHPLKCRCAPRKSLQQQRVPVAASEPRSAGL